MPDNYRLYVGKELIGEIPANGAAALESLGILNDISGD